MLLHQQIGQEHISCELDDFDNQDYLDMMAQFEGTKGFIRWDGELDSYQNYYIVGQDGWTCIVTIPRSVITADATTIFYFQLLLEGAFLLVILYLFIRNYLSERRGRQTLNCFEALGRTYFCVALVDAGSKRCEITKLSDQKPGQWKNIRTYRQLLDLIQKGMYRKSDWPRFQEQFSLPQLLRLHNGELDRRYLEYEGRFPDGPRWVSAEAFAVQGDDARDQVILAFRLIHDSKTEELAKNQMLRESLDSARMANQAKSDFLSRMSHDMRTPMNAVIGFADLARHSLDQPEKALDCLDKVSAASRQLLHLINEVLDTAKIEQGKLELRIAPVDLVRQLEETASLFQLQAKAQRQTFTLEPLELPHRQVLTDGNRLDQILNNLLSNAVKYTPAGGAVSLRAEQLPGSRPDQCICRFTVTDNGIGMSPEFLDKLFLPFEREDTSMTSQTSGVGLGMAHHAEHRPENGRSDRRGQHPGQGVPLCGHHSLRPAGGRSRPAGYGHRRGVPSGGRPAAAGGGQSAEPGDRPGAAGDGGRHRHRRRGRAGGGGDLLLPSPRTFDAILMDIQMPRLDGYGATREIRQLDRPDAETIPILAMTANAFEEDIAAARAAGMDGHIAKPIDIDRIKAALAAVLSGGA